MCGYVNCTAFAHILTLHLTTHMHVSWCVVCQSQCQLVILCRTVTKCVCVLTWGIIECLRVYCKVCI